MLIPATPIGPSNPQNGGCIVSWGLYVCVVIKPSWLSRNQNHFREVGQPGCTSMHNILVGRFNLCGGEEWKLKITILKPLQISTPKIIAFIRPIWPSSLNHWKRWYPSLFSSLKMTAFFVAKHRLFSSKRPLLRYKTFTFLSKMNPLYCSKTLAFQPKWTPLFSWSNTGHQN